MEVVHSLLMAVTRDIDAGVEPDTLQEWRRIFLGTTFIFKYIENDTDFHFAHLQSRENLGIDFASMRHSSLQRILDLAAFKHRMQATTGQQWSAAHVSEQYRSNLQLSETSDDITDSYVDMALTVHSRLLSNQKLADLAMALDEEEGTKNPFDSVCKLQTIVSKSKDKDGVSTLEWTFPLLVDFYRSGALAGEQIGLRALRGTTPGTGGQLKGSYITCCTHTVLVNDASCQFKN